MKRVDDFRLRLGKHELVPIMIGGMGVDISTADLALEAARRTLPQPGLGAGALRDGHVQPAQGAGGRAQRYGDGAVVLQVRRGGALPDDLDTHGATPWKGKRERCMARTMQVQVQELR